MSDTAQDIRDPTSTQTASPARSPKRPNLTTFTDGPNARSTTMTQAAGPDTFGAVNQLPSEPSSFTIGVSEDRGNRRTMEDAFSFVVDFAGVKGQGFFAIFDGHAGKHAAEWCGQNFHQNLLDTLVDNPDSLIPDALAQTFANVDNKLTELTKRGQTNSGCTAATAFLRIEDADGKQAFAPPLKDLIRSSSNIPAAGSPALSTASLSSAKSSHSRGGSKETSTDGAASASTAKEGSTREKLRSVISRLGGNGSPSSSKKSAPAEVTPPADKGPAAFEPTAKDLRKVLYTANVGDARAVLARAGKAVRLTYDHKGSDKAEGKRITDAGGFILNNRVNGVLAVTRSLGDSTMKEFVVGAPYTTETELSEDDQWLIVACDGLWDVTEDQQAVDLIKNCNDAQEASDLLLKHALERFSNDNVTVLVVKFGPKGITSSSTSSS